MSGLPYGIDYLQNVVKQSLGNNEPGSESQSPSPEEDMGGGASGSMNGGAAMYGLPAQAQGVEQSQPQDNYGLGQMGPRFKAMLDQGGMGSVAGAVGPVAGAALSGVDSILPGASAAILGSRKQAGGKRDDFTDAGPPSNLNEYLARLGHYESKNNPLAYNKVSGASGMGQYLDKTWNNYGGYQSAKDAPPQVQFQRMMEDTVDRLKHNNGDLVKATLTHFLGAKGLQGVLQNPQKLYAPVNAANKDTTPYSYGAGILGDKVMKDWAMNQHMATGANEAASRATYNLPANDNATASMTAN